MSHPGASHRQAASVEHVASVVNVAHCPQVGAVYSTVTVAPLHMVEMDCGPQPMLTLYVQPNPDCQFQLHGPPRAGKSTGHSGSGGGGLHDTIPEVCHKPFTHEA